MSAKKVTPAQRALVQEYYLSGERSKEPYFYHVQSKVVAYAEDGTRASVDVYKLRLMCEPDNRSAGEADKYICTRFSLQRDGGLEVTIPVLKGGSYDFNRKSLNEVSLDKQGQLFGIPNAKFEGLTETQAQRYRRKWDTRFTVRSYIITVIALDLLNQSSEARAFRI